MFGLCISNIGKLTYNKTYHYPRWSEALGWFAAGSALMAMPVYAMYKIYRTDGTLKQVHSGVYRRGFWLFHGLLAVS